ncbi:MAG: sugar phosphate isomerase/epimerase [Chloroflexota bacterium]|nr:sugar phosphate isomerase/epimerase [Chloroflexota bacterium]
MHRLAFTTLACPGWSWSEILDRATEYEYEGIELRGIEGEMDLPRARPFLATELPKTRRELAERGLAIPCLDTSCRLHDPDTAANLDEARRSIDLAAELQAPYVRVFGDKIPSEEPREAVLARVAEGLGQLGEYAAASGVQVLIESHGDFAHTADLAAVLEAVEHPQVGVLWDVHHPYRFFGESLEATFDRLKARIRHTHLKDSRQLDGAVLYCAVGEGDLPLRECLELLYASGYDGWLSFEWEKKWHPEIDEPDVVLPAYSQTIRQLEAAIAQ